MSELLGLGEHAIADIAAEPFVGLPGEVAHAGAIVPVDLDLFHRERVAVRLEEVGDDDVFFHG